MFIFYFGMYLLIGLIATFAAAFYNAYKLDKAGYDATEYCDNNIDEATDVSLSESIFALFIWPVTLYMMIVYTFPKMKEQCKLKSNEDEGLGES